MRSWYESLKRYAALLPSYAVLAIALTATTVLTVVAFHFSRVEAFLTFDRSARRLEESVRSRMEVYTDLLVHTRNLFLASDDVNRNEFARFIAALNLNERYPGIQGVGYTIRMTSDEVARHESAVRASGFPEYSVWPKGDRSEFFAIVYLEPFDWRNRRAFGYDMHSEPIRRAAMEKARDTGQPAMTERVYLVQETNVDPQPGFLIYVPLYKGGTVPDTVEERRRDLIGFVFSPFRAHDLFREIVRGASSHDFPLALQVFDGTRVERNRLLFDNTAPDAPDSRLFDPEFSSQFPIAVAGRQWVVEIRSQHNVGLSSTQAGPWYVLAAGIVISLLAYRWSLAQTRYNRSLENSERRLRSIINAMPALVAYVDRDGRYRFVNRSFWEWFGLGSDTLEGKTFGMQTDQYPDANDYLERVLNGEQIDIEKTLPHRQKGDRNVMMHLLPDHGADGDVKGFTLVGTDVTELKQFAASLEQEKKALVILNEDNRKLYEEAQRVNRIKDEFLATLSHELRTPLNVILGHAELLKLEAPPLGDLHESIDAIYRNSKAQTQIVDDLLDVSSIITGKLSFRPEPVDLGEVIRDAIETIRFAANSKEIQVATEFKEEDMIVRADRTRLKQVIWNLLSNAVKFTPARGRIEVTVGRELSRYIIRVRDTGQGIDPQFLPFVFDRFRQEDNSMTRRFGGLGLGLSIVRSLVEAHGGSVNAFSEGRGRGTEFVVALPIPERGLKIERGESSANSFA